MSEWHVRVVRLGKIGRHPNADTLGITSVEGTPVIVKDGFYKPGDLAVYVPIDSLMPSTEDNLAMFGKKLRVKAKKIRGIYSQGYLMPCGPELPQTEGTVVHELVGITKWEPPLEVEMDSRGRCEAAPRHFLFPAYTDIEGLRKWQNVLLPGEQVVITEKLHGANARFCHDGERLWVGSRKQIKAEDESTWWWRVVKNQNLAEKFSAFPLTVFYGEVFGKGVQDLSYGTDITFRVFDTLDAKTGNYNDISTTWDITQEAGLNDVPILYVGSWKGFEGHQHLAEGNSTLGGDHTREGFVVRPIRERYETHSIGRVILKLIGEGYNLRS